MRFRSALLAATVLAAPLAAKAEPVSGIYIGAGAGATYIQRQKIRISNGAPLNASGQPLFGSGHAQWDVGFVGLASVGYGFGNGLRVELEGDYRQNNLSKIGGISPQARPVGGGGYQQMYGPMVNVFYDLAFIPYVSQYVTPYVGLGAGYQWAQWHGLRSYDNVGNQMTFNRTEGSFAAQAIAGVSFPIPVVPGLAATLEYRFMALPESNTYGGTETSSGLTGVRAGRYAVSAKAIDGYNHSVLLGIRYAFNTPVPPPPAPPPVAAPAPAPARSYLIFFDWDRYNLTERGRQIVREAADNSTRVQYTRLQVNGYTDTSGTPQYNQRLSVRRAQTVAAELVKDGVPRSAISIQGFGETHLLVPTGPGVREPQNRRVEIIIQ